MSNMKNFFKYASLLLAAVVLASCRGTVDTGDDTPVDGTNGITISTDKTLIQSNGTDFAKLTVIAEGKDVTSEALFFDASNNLLEITDGKFSVTEPGEYELWANYGTLNSGKVTIRAISIPVPETPADPAPQSTDFKARVYMAQFTGTGCGFCPNMMRILHPVLEDPDYSDKIVWTAFHTYNATDPAYIFGAMVDEFKDNLKAEYPSLNFDFRAPFSDYRQTSQVIKDYVDQCLADKIGAPAGIAVNATLVDDTVIAKVTIKSADTREYRVGAMLLEDGIYAMQTSADAAWMNTHDSCVRYIDCSTNPLGYNLGVINKGKTVDYLFIWDLNKIWSPMMDRYAWDKWVESNLRMAVYVTSPNAEGSFAVNNAIQCPVNGQTAFDYAK